MFTVNVPELMMKMAESRKELESVMKFSWVDKLRLSFKKKPANIKSIIEGYKNLLKLCQQASGFIEYSRFKSAIEKGELLVALRRHEALLSEIATFLSDLGYDTRAYSKDF